MAAVIILLVTLAVPYSRFNPNRTLPPQLVDQPVCGQWHIMFTSSSFRSVAALSDRDIWFAGMKRGLSNKLGPAFARWDGSTLTAMPDPNLEDAGAIGIEALAVRTDEDAWAVGYMLQERQNKLVSFHWNGKEWTLVPTPDPPSDKGEPVTSVPNKYAELTAVTIVSEKNVWAVGHYPQNGLSKTLILHWDGNQWEVISSPNIEGTDNYLYGVVSISDDDIWALGHAGPTADQIITMALHWDGISWKLVDVPDLGPVIAASSDSTGNIWVVNNNITAKNMLGSAVRRSGDGRWDVIPMPQVTQPALHSVSALSSDDVWAVGVKWSGYPPDAEPNQIATRSLVLHWDGSNWSEVPGPDPSYIQSLEAVAVSLNGDVWVVGASAANKDSPVHWMVGRFVRCAVGQK
jgi:hypothetical protein